ncbi:Aminotransferase, class IV [mine drainage metagenome]|uniref:Aminotransferase, class IV n=1 Tax=mine drainage metagenome TaxID=410659 RepID=T1ABV5_9ZZZZ
MLRGVTRDSVIQFVKDEGLIFQRTDFSREELFTADELFFTGTAAGITPIGEVDGRRIGNASYPITYRLQKRYDDAIHGRAKEYARWLTYVPSGPGLRAGPTRGPVGSKRRGRRRVNSY